MQKKQGRILRQTKFMRILLCLSLLLPFSVFAQYKLGNGFLDYRPSGSAFKAIEYGNIRLYPIIAKDSFKLAFSDIGRFTTLKEAMEQKKIVITEKGEGGTVNTVYAENISADTIILNCGEVIMGGKQDRVINSDMVLYP